MMIFIQKKLPKEKELCASRALSIQKLRCRWVLNFPKIVMAKGISNWSHDDVVEFLKYHKFFFGNELGGSHYTWISENRKFIVDVNRTKSSYPELTILTMIANSGLDKEHWRKWTTLNKNLKKKLVCCELDK